MASLPPASSMMTSNVATYERLDLTADSAREKEEADAARFELEIKDKMFEIGDRVPTLRNDVEAALRSMRQPICLFGENPADVRERLRRCMARMELVNQQSLGDIDNTSALPTRGLESEETTETKYTHASSDLRRAREDICRFSLPRAKRRLLRERKLRQGTALRAERGVSFRRDEETEEEIMVGKLHHRCSWLYRKMRTDMALEGSQYGGDNRPLAAVGCTRTSLPKPRRRDDLEEDVSPKKVDPLKNYIVVTGGWSGNVKVWDSDGLDLLAQKTVAHQDRIMSLAIAPNSQMDNDDENNDSSNVVGSASSKHWIATASIDLTARIFSLSVADNGNDMDVEGEKKSPPWVLKEEAKLVGHQARLGRVAWHPSGRYVGTTSTDHTWRLWDVETGSCVLVQDGHRRECHGISMGHPDGSLVATTDYGGFTRMWDLRTGRSIAHCRGHAGRVLCAEFSPKLGLYLTTAGDDGSVRVWDLRKRLSPLACLPAHTRLVSQLRFDESGEVLATSSFDGTARLWSARRWTLLHTLRGHSDKVMSLDFCGGAETGAVVTVGYDKTLKLWN